MTRTSVLRRLGAGLIATALAVATLTAPGSAGAAATFDTAKASAFLTDGLTGGNRYEQFGFPDVGLTIDGLYALAAAHDSATVSAISTWLARDPSGPDDYSTAATWSGVAEATYADGFSGGSVAKVALAAEIAGQDPRSFGGHDYITALTDHVCTTVDANNGCQAAGYITGVSSTFGQALALLALRRADVAPPAAAVSAITGLACANGGFIAITPGPCPDASNADPDSTAMAVMALAAVGGHRTAVSKALSWLVGAQLSDGSWNSPGAAQHSTNSTGLAIQGLTLAGTKYAAQITKARAYLAGRQQTDGGLPINDETGDSDLRATTQAFGGYLGTSLADVSVKTTEVAPHVTTAHAASAYLVRQLVDGDHAVLQNYPDPGLTADIAIALLADRSQDAALARVLAYLRTHAADYADTAGQFDGPYSGAAAKLALVAELTGSDPHDYSGIDLISLITSKVCTAKQDTDPSPCTAPGDVYNAFSGIGQALAVLAVQRADGGLSPQTPMVARLLQLQCADGGFSSTLIDPGAPCTAEVDTTGFAVQALSLVAGTSDAVRAAQSYLAGQQEGSGGFAGTAGLNTNSTALGVQGLLPLPAGTARAAVAVPTPYAAGVGQALTFLDGRQSASGGLAINPTNPTADARATAQAVPSLLLWQLSTAAPRTVAAAPPTSGTPTTTAPSSRPATTGGGAAGGGSGDAAGGGALANTGTPAHDELLLALALLCIGAGLLMLGRRPTPVHTRGAHR